MPKDGFGTGLAAADFDDDGWVDLFVPTAAGSPNRLYRNLGNGRFEDVAGAKGLGSLAIARVGLWLDYDGDQRLDLLVAGDCYSAECSDETYLRLYRQTETGLFVETTAAAGVLAAGTREQHRSGMAAGDVNGDGYLDFVTGNWMGSLKLYLNRGDGTFVNGTVASGLDEAVLGYHQPLMNDFDLDGLVDIFAAVDFSENRLWMNQGLAGGQALFVDLAKDLGCNNAMNDMGVAVGDYDDDGDPDLYVTNIYRDEQHNVLLENNLRSIDAAACAEISLEAGVQDGGWGWGATFFDSDNNGLLDLAETNGWRFVGWNEPPRLYQRQPGISPSFIDEAAQAGLTDTSWGSTMIAFDYDRDGDLDLAQSLRPGRVGLYQNQLQPRPGETSTDRHFLTIQPRMVGPNSRAIGARIAVETEEKTMTRFVLAGTSYLGQEPAEAFFGVGASTIAKSVTVWWPAGGTTVLYDVPVDQVVSLTHPGIFVDSFDIGNTGAWSTTTP